MKNVIKVGETFAWERRFGSIHMRKIFIIF